MSLRRYLVSGTLTLLPLTVTIWVLLRLFDMLDAWSASVTTHFIGYRIPGAGFAVTLMALIITGIVATNVIGRQLLSRLENTLVRLPLVRSIYTAVRQLVDVFASPQKAAFQKVVLIEYPRHGLWSVGFITAEPSPLLSQAVGKTIVTVFVPTTPNPTSGFFLGVPQDECLPLDMSVEEAFKLIISGGAIEPPVTDPAMAIARAGA